MHHVIYANFGSRCNLERFIFKVAQLFRVVLLLFVCREATPALLAIGEATPNMPSKKRVPTPHETVAERVEREGQPYQELMQPHR